METPARVRPDRGVRGPVSFRPGGGVSAREAPTPPGYREFTRRRDGMIFAMDGGLWLHRHLYKGEPMAHLVSTDRELLLRYGHAVGMPDERLQYKPLKDPRTGQRRPAWHWDLVRQFLPPPVRKR